jgi:hypothetical protein
LPVCFWGDPSGEKLRDAYFSMYPGIFHSINIIELMGTHFLCAHQVSGARVTSLYQILPQKV